MKFSSFELRALAAAALMAAGAAQAASPVVSTASTALASNNGTTVLDLSSPTPASSVLAVDVAGAESWYGHGNADNYVLWVQLAPYAEVTGVGWDVTITTNGASWLSEAKVAIESSDGSAGLFLTPGVGEGFGGTGSYSSDGVLSLVDLGLNFNVGADGLLRLEFFEGYVDYEEPDAIWNSGTLSLEVSAVPEPATYGMMALGLLAVGGLARRRAAK